MKVLIRVNRNNVEEKAARKIFYSFDFCFMFFIFFHDPYILLFVIVQGVFLIVEFLLQRFGRFAWTFFVCFSKLYFQIFIFRFKPRDFLFVIA